jgi:hypothetical protein
MVGDSCGKARRRLDLHLRRWVVRPSSQTLSATRTNPGHTLLKKKCSLGAARALTPWLLQRTNKCACLTCFLAAGSGKSLQGPGVGKHKAGCRVEGPEDGKQQAAGSRGASGLAMLRCIKLPSEQPSIDWQTNKPQGALDALQSAEALSQV